MKNIFLIFAVILAFSITFTSCNSKSGKRLEEKKQKTTGTVVNSDDIFASIDTPHDAVIRELKKLPEYEDATFLSPKETKEYLDILIQNQERFLTEKRYTQYSDNKGGYAIDLKISIDTTQSLRPLAKWSSYFYYDEGDSSTTEIAVYYLPKLKVMYLEQISNYEPFIGEYIIFGTEIRNGFPKRK